jgi:hypothetical protein
MFNVLDFLTETAKAFKEEESFLREEINHKRKALQEKAKIISESKRELEEDKTSGSRKESEIKAKRPRTILTPLRLRAQIYEAEQTSKVLQKKLSRLEEKYRELTATLHPTDKNWNFEEIDRAITDIHNQVFNVIKTSTDSLKAAADTPLAGITGLGKLGDLKSTFLEAYKRAVEAEQLQNKRQGLLSGYLRGLKSKDKHALTAELEKRKRDLSQLPRELKVGGQSIEFFKPTLDKERRFLEDIIIELEAALNRAQEPKTKPREPIKKVDPAAEAIAKIKKLHEQMDAALQNNPAELHADIRRVYGKLIDEERAKL